MRRFLYFGYGWTVVQLVFLSFNLIYRKPPTVADYILLGIGLVIIVLAELDQRKHQREYLEGLLVRWGEYKRQHPELEVEIARAKNDPESNSAHAK